MLSEGPQRISGEQSKEREARINRVGIMMANQFQIDPTLLLDMDGVIMQGDSLHEPRLTDPLMIPALQGLENLGVKIGPATGRSAHVLNYLREQGLQMAGPAILEEGQTLIRDGVVEHFGHPNHKNFMESVVAEMRGHEEIAANWNEVRSNAATGKFSFCEGNEQWQGDSRSSFWFHYEDDPEKDTGIVARLFGPFIEDFATINGLTPHDLALSVYRMQPSSENGNLAIIGLKGRLDGEIITKATAAQTLFQDRNIVAPTFVADGFGDMPIAKVINQENGLILGIEGNLDISREPNAFLDVVGKDNVLKDPRELAKALTHAGTLLQQNLHTDGFKPTQL